MPESIEREVTGYVKRVSHPDKNDNPKQYGIKVANDSGFEEWLNDWGEVPDNIERGADVTVEYEEVRKNGRTFRNIEDITRLDTGNSADNPGSSDQKTASTQASGNIDRQSVVKSASRIFEGRGKLSEDEVMQLKGLMQMFDAYIEGDELEDAFVNPALLRSFEDNPITDPSPEEGGR